MEEEMETEKLEDIRSPGSDEKYRTFEQSYEAGADRETMEAQYHEYTLNKSSPECLSGEISEVDITQLQNTFPQANCFD